MPVVYLPMLGCTHGKGRFLKASATAHCHAFCQGKSRPAAGNVSRQVLQCALTCSTVRPMGLFVEGMMVTKSTGSMAGSSVATMLIEASITANRCLRLGLMNLQVLRCSRLLREPGWRRQCAMTPFEPTSHAATNVLLPLHCIGQTEIHAMPRMTATLNAVLVTRLKIYPSPLQLPATSKAQA